MTITGRKATALVAALILSASLNVFAAAAWGTHELWAEPRRSGFGRLVRSAPAEAQETVEARFEAIKPDMQERIAAVRAARADIARLMRDPDTDPAALDAAFAELRARRDSIEILVHRTLVEAMAEMPPEIRGRWAEEWSRRR